MAEVAVLGQVLDVEIADQTVSQNILESMGIPGLLAAEEDRPCLARQLERRLCVDSEIFHRHQHSSQGGERDRYWMDSVVEYLVRSCSTAVFEPKAVFHSHCCYDYQWQGRFA